MALFERYALAYQTVQVWRIHVFVAEPCDGVVPLLVGDDKDDVRTIIIGDGFVNEHKLLFSFGQACVRKCADAGFGTIT